MFYDITFSHCLVLYSLRTFYSCAEPAKRKFWDLNAYFYAPFTRVRINLCTDKNLHDSTLRLHGTGGTGQIFERLSVQVWDLKRAGQLFDWRAGSCTDPCKHPNRATFCSDSAALAWNQMPRLV